MKKILIVIFSMAVVMCFAFNDLMAQGIGLTGVGGRLGFVNPGGRGNGTIFLGGHANLGSIIPNLVLYPSLEFSRKSLTIIVVNGDLRYYVETPGNIKPFGGGGLAIIVTSNDSDVGLDLLGGADFSIAPNITAFGEIKYTISDNSIFRLTGGITVKLGQ